MSSCSGYPGFFLVSAEEKRELPSFVSGDKFWELVLKGDVYFARRKWRA